MAFQTSIFASDAYSTLRGNMPGWKLQAQSALTFVQSNNIDSDYVFRLLTSLRSIIDSIASSVSIGSGLNTYATSLGYSGTIINDANAVSTAAANVGIWVINNFPKDSGGFAQAYTINADGTRTAAVFTPAQTTGLQTTLSALISTIQ